MYNALFLCRPPTVEIHLRDMAFASISQWALGFSTPACDKKVTEDVTPPAAELEVKIEEINSVTPAFDWPNDLGVCSYSQEARQ